MLGCFSHCGESDFVCPGILFWLNYKNTYEHWNAQRGAFTTASNDAARLRSLVLVPTSPTSLNELNLMFQLHIIDLGIAVPLQQTDLVSKVPATDHLLPTAPSLSTSDESGDFLVFTLDQTTISACSCGAIISSGSFRGFCLRFAENFQQTTSSWKPASPSSSSNPILNACCVPSGEYSMHSLAQHLDHSTGPKWFLNVQWDMQGIDINLNSMIGKHFSQLIRTITATQLIESTNAFNLENASSSNSNSLHHQTDSLISKNDDSDEDIEKRKRLEYEYSILGQKIASLR